MKYDVILTAAGSGSRSGLSYNKVFLPINELPCIMYSIKTFMSDIDMQHLYITIRAKDEQKFKDMLETYTINTQNITFIYGGNTRQESVYAALKFVKGYQVFVHDGARPFINMSEITQLKAALKFEKAAILALKITDTLKEVDAFQQINRTINREKIYAAQTPQAFVVDELLKVHEQAVAEEFSATDDAQLFEMFSKHHVQIIAGTKYNLKVTMPDDIMVATIFAQTIAEMEE